MDLELLKITFQEGKSEELDKNDKLSVFLNKLPKEVKDYIFYTYIYPDMIQTKYYEIIYHIKSDECKLLTREGYTKLSEILKSILFDKSLFPVIKKLCNNHSGFKTSYYSHRSGNKGFVNFDKITSLAMDVLFISLNIFDNNTFPHIFNGFRYYFPIWIRFRK